NWSDIDNSFADGAGGENASAAGLWAPPPYAARQPRNSFSRSSWVSGGRSVALTAPVSAIVSRNCAMYSTHGSHSFRCASRRSRSSALSEPSRYAVTSSTSSWQGIGATSGKVGLQGGTDLAAGAVQQ